MTLVVVLVFGSLTLLTGQGMFFYMKTTLGKALFAIALIGGRLLGRPLLKPLMISALELDDLGWRKLTLRFGLFFAAVAVLNEIIWRTQPEAIWVDFKAFGILALNALFIISQVPMIMRHQIKQPSE